MKKCIGLLLCVLITPIFASIALADAPISFTGETSSLKSLAAPAPQQRANGTPLAATLTFFNDRATFEAIVPGIPTETFESGLVGPFGVLECPSPLSAATPGGCFPAGSLLDGWSYASSDGTSLVALGSGVVGNPTTAIAVNFFNQNGTITFSNPNVFAAGFDLFNNVNGPVTLSVFSASGLEGQMTIPTAGGTFFGVTSDTPITAIEVGTVGAPDGEVIDNLSFGEGCPCAVTNSLFADFVNDEAPVASFLECRDDEDNTGVLALLTDGSIVGAASGTKGGRPNMCGTQVNNGTPDFITITPGEDAACRSLLRAVCPD